ncbi:ClpP-like prohead protease/major capsid protein fusion protein [Arenimonas oryziterrae]|uniref:ATP-dependent Clp protease proteolytic subunit n=1 Tax=Arenimonas oryziterrae DSM 21050 = YC6267 TaxID=1121015 RepID=A0A091BD30_9GAMM|nr:ClpP-like prohead protease/major capsid protein fusion protein [Arenimonas oryziterrae]KFN42310.1 peptidase [Arenimonas oryziterrae DSM 21050 = YC6267]
MKSNRLSLAIFAAVAAIGGAPPASSGLQPLLRIQALANGDAELLIYGPIGDEWFSESASARSIAEQLARITAPTIQVRINSEGGSVQDGLAIYNQLKRHPARIVVTVDGIAASIASQIACAGDEVIMPANTLMMIHAPWSCGCGNAQAFREFADTLDTFAAAMAQSYVAKTGKSVEEINALLQDGKDHWFTSEQAVEFGLADSALATDPVEPADADAVDAMLNALIANTRLTASAPAPISAQLRSRLTTTLTESRFASLPEARQLAIVASIGDEEMKQQFQKVLAMAVAAAAAAPAPAAPAAPASLANPDAALQPTQGDPVATALAALVVRNQAIRGVFAGFHDVAGVVALESECLADPAMTIEQAQARLLARVGNGATPLAGTGRVEAGEDETERVRAAGVQMLLARGGILSRTDAAAARQGNPFANSTLLGMAEQILIRAGVRTRDMTREQMARAVLGQTTSDFPTLLENALHKILLNGYQLTPFTWTRFCRTGILTDYRPHNRYHLSSFSDLLEVNEAGEYKTGTLGDGEKETITGKRKGRILEVTPELLINDDLGALVSLATALGQAAGRTIEKDVYALLALNSGAGPTLSDGKALFHTDHANIAAVGAAPSVSAFDAARIALGSQKDPGGNDYLDITAAIWLGPLSIGGAARVANGAEYDTEVSSKFQVPNKVRNMYRDVVDSPRLAGNAWYSFADPNVEAVLEVAFLDGVQTPTIEQEANFRTDGIAWKAAHRYGVGAVGYRGAQKNNGP